MPYDVYKKTPIETISEEHILLDSLGGRLGSKALLDKSTNDRFGATIDIALADCLLPIRVLLDAKAADGRSPPPLRGVKAKDGRLFNLLPGGKPEMAAPRIDVDEREGKLAIEGHARSMREARQLMRRVLAKHSLPIELLEKIAKSGEEHIPDLEISLEYDSNVWRGILKTACNLLAYQRSDLFLDSGFDAVRKFVLDGDGHPWDFLAFNTSPIDLALEGRQFGDVDHLVVLNGDCATGDVLGLVVLYGQLQFTVRLGVGPIVSSFTSAYRVDQLGGRDRLDAGEDASIEVPAYHRYSEAHYSRWLESQAAAMNRLMPYVMRRAREAAVRSLIEKSMKETFGAPDGSPITEAQMEDFASRVSERFVAMMFHQGMFNEDD